MIEKNYGSKLILNGPNPTYNIWQMGYEMAMEHTYCGNRLPDDYTTASKTIFIKFHSNNQRTGKGFHLTAHLADGCYANFTGSQGTIRLSESSNCDFYIRSPINTTLSLYFRDILFSEYDCEKEYLEIYDVYTNTSLQKLCNYIETGKALFSQSNYLRIHSSLNGYFSQLYITYLASRNGIGCGGDLFSTSGVITSPFYPSNHRLHMDCIWQIQVPSNLRIYLKFIGKFSISL